MMDTTITLALLLRKACSNPARLSVALGAFHRFAIRNQLLAVLQCEQRRVAPVELATAQEWRERRVEIRAGERPLALCRSDSRADGHPVPKGLVLERRWFLASQTTAGGAAPAAPAKVLWSASEALSRFGVMRLEFSALGSADTGYSFRRFVAVHPRAPYPEMVLIHGLAHIRLGHSQETERRHRNDLADDPAELMAEATALLVGGALGFAGASTNARSIREALAAGTLEDRDVRRIFETADEILHAGRFAAFPRPSVSPTRRHVRGKPR